MFQQTQSSEVQEIELWKDPFLMDSHSLVSFLFEDANLENAPLFDSLATPAHPEGAPLDPESPISVASENSSCGSPGGSPSSSPSQNAEVKGRALRLPSGDEKDESTQKKRGAKRARATTEKPNKKAKSSPKIEDDEDNHEYGKTAVSLTKDQLLTFSSQDLDDFVQKVAGNRSLTLLEEKEIQWQRRRIKNRESAQASRYRRKAYIDELEARVKDLTSERDDFANQTAILRSENNALKERISQLEQSKNSARQIGGGHKRTYTGAAAVGACLMVFLFSFGFFVNMTIFAGVPAEPIDIHFHSNPICHEKVSIVAGDQVVTRSFSRARNLLADEEGDQITLQDSPPTVVPESSSLNTTAADKDPVPKIGDDLRILDQVVTSF